ncbi:valine--pyruvate aminotransferase-like [Ylistrum balloti]|uniref:valine--pyruvate aminotransferase-like n=1 Tax=Ylistrum balloti TaxID=509963 RepID=UPI002905939E|nr:valine--pyruvate aminotransferase-like [Ylistrum balloti]
MKLTQAISSKRDISPFYVMEVMAKADKLEAEGQQICHLEVGELDFQTPKEIQESTIEALQSGAQNYTHTLGNNVLRQAIATKFLQEDIVVEIEQILVSTGTSPILFMVLAAVLDAGDEVILFDPGYPCYANFAKLLNIKIRTVKLKAEDGFRPNPNSLRQAIGPRTKAIILCSPANPTGVVLTPEELEKLADLGCWLIVDEIYRSIEYGCEPVPSSLKLNRPNIIIVDGFSKKYAMTGYRLGYGIFPRILKQKIQVIHQNLMISANPFVQAGGITALTHPQVELTRQVWLKELQKRRAVLMSGLDVLGINIFAKPEGAFYLLADFRWTGKKSLTLADEILDQCGVALTPGIDFGTQAEGFLRFSFSKSVPIIEKALTRLNQWIKVQ